MAPKRKAGSEDERSESEEEASASESSASSTIKKKASKSSAKKKVATIVCVLLPLAVAIGSSLNMHSEKARHQVQKAKNRCCRVVCKLVSLSGPSQHTHFFGNRNLREMTTVKSRFIPMGKETSTLT